MFSLFFAIKLIIWILDIREAKLHTKTLPLVFEIILNKLSKTFSPEEFITEIFLVSVLFSKVKVIKSDKLKNYIDRFNKKDDEIYKQFITNDEALLFLSKNIPMIDSNTSIEPVNKTFLGFLVTIFPNFFMRFSI